MNLSEFLSLSDEEKVQQQKILKLAEAKGEVLLESKSVSKNRLLNINPYTLIKLAIIDKEINKICSSPEFTSYWQDLWRQSSFSPHEYLPMPTVSCFDLLKGLYIYDGYRDLVENTEMTVEVREKAECI